MARFRYHARDADGTRIEGEIEALDEHAVATQLLARSIIPVDIMAAKSSQPLLPDWLHHLGAKQRIPLTELSFFCRQMYTLLNAGVPIFDALKAIQESASNPVLVQVVNSIVEGLNEGNELSTTLRRHPRIFSPMFVSVVEVGETTGMLADSFARMATYIEREDETRKKIQAALRYPAIVLIAITVAMFIINFFVIPAFAKVFQTFHAQLPWQTRFLMACSQFMLDYWPVILAGGAVLIIALGKFVKTPSGRSYWDALKLRLPVVGKIIRHAIVARFAASMSIIAETGIAWSKGIAVVSRVVDNAHFEKEILAMRDGIEHGDTITGTARKSGLFPALVIQMISVGEETGAIDRLMAEVAEYHEREVDHALKNISASIEPILITLIGAMVLLLALGVFLPMWDLGKAALH